MLSRRFVTAIRAARRTITPLTLAGLLLPWTFGPVAPVRADEPIVRDNRDPDARIQVVIKSVHIFDNHDLLGGEIRLHALLAECVGMDCSDVSCNFGNCYADGPVLAEARIGFSAAFGETKTLSRSFPGAGDTLAVGVSESAGFPVRSGKRYRFVMAGLEEDDGPIGIGPGFPDELGTFGRELDESSNWGSGTHFQRSRNGDAFGDFEVRYEIRRAPLPDLVPHNLRTIEADGQQFFCLSVLNEGQRPSDPFPLTVRADRELVRTVDPMPALEVNATTEHCVVRSELPAGEHTLEFRIDGDREVAEMNESNNTFEVEIPARQATVGGPPPTAGR